MRTDATDRPAIIFGLQPGASVTSDMKPLFNGIEEEQIPSATREIDVADVVQRAYQSALSSRLSVGIANDGNRFIVHYKNLKEDQPLFDEVITDRQQLRDLGSNAARLVKGIPLKGITYKGKGTR
jgi:hypothetical protein